MYYANIFIRISTAAGKQCHNLFAFHINFLIYQCAQTNGGGAFLIAWVVFLLLWSIPLILVEFAMGRESRCGPIGAFARLVGAVGLVALTAGQLAWPSSTTWLWIIGGAFFWRWRSERDLYI